MPVILLIHLQVTLIVTLLYSASYCIAICIGICIPYCIGRGLELLTCSDGFVVSCNGETKLYCKLVPQNKKF